MKFFPPPHEAPPLLSVLQMDPVSDSPVVQAAQKHLRRWPRRTVITMAAVGLFLLAMRIALPFVLKQQINRRLAAIPGYHGRVERVDVSIFRGAYTMAGVRIQKLAGGVAQPFFSAEQVDFSLFWGDLFHGRVVSEIALDHPRLNFVQGATAASSQLDVTDQRWQDVIRDLFPIEITRLDVHEGAVHFAAPDRDPPVDVFIQNLTAKIRGLRNRPDPAGGEYPAQILIGGTTKGRGRLSLAAELEPLAAQPHFHLVFKIDRLELPMLNPFLRSYANVDVRQGLFTGYLEMFARDGHFNGYLKPFFEDLDFDNAAVDEKKGVFTRLWENLVAAFTRLVTNDRTEKMALRIPFSGDFTDPQVGVWASVRTLFRNGFIQALQEGLDGHAKDRPVPTPSDPDPDKS
jgi:hypothetical protein